MAIEVHAQPPVRAGLFAVGRYKWRIAITDDSGGEPIVFRIHGGEAPLKRAQAEFTQILADIAREYPAALVGAL